MNSISGFSVFPKMTFVDVRKLSSSCRNYDRRRWRSADAAFKVEVDRRVNKTSSPVEFVFCLQLTVHIFRLFYHIKRTFLFLDRFVKVAERIEDREGPNGSGNGTWAVLTNILRFKLNAGP